MAEPARQDGHCGPSGAPVIESAPCGGREGAITLARHAEPALSRQFRLSAKGYRRWWAMYEAGGIVAGQTPPESLRKAAGEAGSILASTRRRAIETAHAVLGARPFVSDALFVEAPLPPPPLPDFIKLKPKTWGALARAAWWFGHHEGGETRAAAEVRARAAADRLIGEAEKGCGVLLLAHGYFNLMVGRELKRRGWRQVGGKGYKYWSTRRYVRP